jgi:hypothetical protein
LRRLDDRRFAGGRFDAGTGKLSFQFAIAIGIGHGGKAGTELTRQACERLGAAMRGHRLDAVPAGLLFEEIDRTRPDRAGSAKQRDRAWHGRQFYSRQRLLLFHRLTIPASRGPAHPFLAEGCR